MIAWTNAYIGIPYADLNCWELAVRVLSERGGVEAPTYSADYTSPEESAELSALIAGERVVSPWVEVEHAQELDIVILWVRRPDRATHVGVAVSGERMLTTSRSTGSVLSTYRRGFWSSRVVGFARHEGLVC